MGQQPSANGGRGVVLVTGASSGIGKDASLYLNELGYTVVAGVRKLEDGERLCAEARHASAFHPMTIDVTSQKDVLEARDSVAALLPPGEGLTGLFSNAGIAAYDGDVSCECCPLETQERVMSVNFFGAVRVVQAFLPLLRAGQGTIVFNSAMMAHTVIPFNGGYAASKCALEGWADGLRREVRSFGVRVVIIRAAAIATSLEAKQDPTRIPNDGPYPFQRALIEHSMVKLQSARDDRSCSPRRFSELVATAIASRNPKTRRIVGGGARKLYVLGCLPDRAQDFLMTKLVERMARQASERESTGAPAASAPRT
jgi:NAD(P)-dependent dehydrogenase (short-subunit alcohol dehydrogenase family)